jgi:hypothetical protein
MSSSKTLSFLIPAARTERDEGVRGDERQRGAPHEGGGLWRRRGGGKKGRDRRGGIEGRGGERI